MTAISSTIGGNTMLVDIDDTLRANHRTRLGEALGDISRSGRGLEIDLPDGRTVFVPHSVVHALALDGRGTLHRIDTLSAALQNQGVSAEDAPGVAARILAGLDQLPNTRFARATPSDAYVGISLRDERIVVASPTGDVIETFAPVPQQVAATSTPAIAARAVPERRHPPLDPRARFALNDLAHRGMGASIAMDPTPMMYDSAATIPAGTPSFTITPEQMQALAASSNPIAELRRLAIDAGTPLSVDAAVNLLPSIGYGHNVLSRGVEALGGTAITAELWGASAAHATRVEVTPAELADLAAAQGEARLAVMERVAERAHIPIGEGDERFVNLMGLVADIQDAVLLEASTFHRPPRAD